jgi:hypothetical protein
MSKRLMHALDGLLGRIGSIDAVEQWQATFMLDIDVHPSAFNSLDLCTFNPKKEKPYQGSSRRV